MNLESRYVPALKSEVRIAYDEGQYIATLANRAELGYIFGAGSTTAAAISDLAVTLAEIREHLTTIEDKLAPGLTRQLAALRRLAEEQAKGD